MNITRRKFLAGSAGLAALSVMPVSALAALPDTSHLSSTVEPSGVSEYAGEMLLELDPMSFKRACTVSRRHLREVPDHFVSHTTGNVWVTCNTWQSPVVNSPRQATLPTVFMFASTNIVNLEACHVIKSRDGSSFQEILSRVPAGASRLIPY